MSPERPKPIPSFAPAKDTGGFWREKMANQIDEDVIISWDEKTKCLLQKKKT